MSLFFIFRAEDGVRYPLWSRGLGCLYKRQDHILAGLKMMAEMGTSPSQVADVIMKAIHSDEILPRYTVGADAVMFMEAKQSKTDIEFEKYMSKELFPG